MKKELLIICAGGFAREVLNYVLDIQKTKKVDWELKGFLSDYPDVLDNLDTYGYKIVGDIQNYQVNENEVFTCAIGESKDRKTLCEKFLEKGAKFINVVHPLAGISSNSMIGVGNIFCPYSGVSANCKIGNFNIINAFSSIGHDAEINDFCTISSYCDITGRTKLMNGVFLGSHAVICPRVIVEENVIVGAGSVVIKKVKSNVTVFGNPAREIF